MRYGITVGTNHSIGDLDSLRILVTNLTPRPSGVITKTPHCIGGRNGSAFGAAVGTLESSDIDTCSNN